MSILGTGQRNSLTAVAAVVAILAMLAPVRRAAAGEEPSPLEIYGFAMGDYIQDSKRVDPNWLDGFRPSKISVDGEFGTNGQASVSVKQSRFGIKGTLPTAEGLPPVDYKFEIDFFGVGVDEGQTTVRLRHFYFEWGQLLAGQTHSLFMDIDAFPDVIDYWGPSGLVFWRHPQIRWSPVHSETNLLAFALEGPSNSIDPGNIRLIDQFAEADIQSDQKAPDITAQFRHDGDWGHFQLAGIARRLGYEYRVTSDEPWSTGKVNGWGIEGSLVLKTTEMDKLLLQVVHGDGVASYMNDGGMDIAPTAAFNPLLAVPTLRAEAVPLTGVSAYYNHYWSSKWESAFGYSFTQVSNTNFQEPTVFHKGQYASFNLLAYPFKDLMIGAEVLWGKLTQNGGQTGDDFRFQFSAKYSFDFKVPQG